MRDAGSALWELTVARTKLFVREPEALFWVFAFPLILALVLGFAFREKGPDKTPVGIVDGPSARQIQKMLAVSPALLPRIYSSSDARTALRTGKISLLVETAPSVTFRFDATRPDSRLARMEVNEALQVANGRRDVVAIHDQRVTEPGSRYIDFLIPGLLGMNLMGTGMWGVGFSIVTARNQKLLKRFVATPMRKSDYLLAQMLSRLVFFSLEVVTLVGFGWLVFGVAVHGSILALAFVCVLGALMFSGLGLLVAARPETVEGVSGLMNLVMMPMWLLSGVFFSAERFPDVMQPFIRLLPLTALNDALRAVMTEGKALTTIGPDIAILTAWLIVSFVVALRIFKWR